MRPRLLRLAYVLEFLVGLVAIFTGWSEIGGQATLDLMHWAWKLGLSGGLAMAVVGYTAALVSNERVWTLRSALWLMIILLFLLAIGVVTYYYSLQVDVGDPSEESGTISTLYKTCNFV